MIARGGGLHRNYLVDGLAGTVDDFREAGPERPMVVELGDSRSS